MPQGACSEHPNRDGATAMEHDIDKLASLIRGLQHAIAKLATDNHTEELMRIIHKPGWTTLAEFGLMLAGLEAAQSHAETLARQLRGLTAGARQVG
jgi:hypothetical protein